MSVICLSLVHILVSYQFSIFEKLPLLMEKQKKHQQLWLRVPKKFRTHGGTRTPNLRFRRPTPYPLGHAGKLVYYLLQYWGKVSKFLSTCLSPEKKTVHSTMYSQAVTHPSTNMAQCCLTSVIGRELGLST